MYEVHGTPKDLGGAQALADCDKDQFEWWAVSLVNAQPQGGKKKGADRGIDGVIYYWTSTKRTEKVVVSVKSGKNIGVQMTRDLRGGIERKGASIGLFITLAEPTHDMLKEAVGAGVYECDFGKYPKIQIYTIGELFSGRRPHLPPVDTGAMFKKAARERPAATQGALAV